MEEFDVAKRRAMYLLGGKDYSRNELISKLKKNYSEETAVKAADLMCEYGYVDDERYAKKLAKLYLNVRKYGRQRAALMMRQKGLEAEIIEGALDEYSAEDISSELAGLIRKKYMDRLFLPGIEGKKETQKVIAALARRGYGYSDISSAFELIREELDETEDDY